MRGEPCAPTRSLYVSKNAKVFIVNSAHARNAAKDAVMSITGEGPVMTVTIAPYNRNRTKDQNSAYWKVILEPIEEATGEEAKLWHEFFKRMFVAAELRTFHGLVLEMRETTTKMTTVEFMSYVESIRRWTAENLNITLPEIDSSKKVK